MPATKKINLKNIKGLMVFCQVLLLMFTFQWLLSQYNDQQAQLKQNLTDLFTKVQDKITDSLITGKVAPGYANMVIEPATPPCQNCGEGDSQHVQLSQQSIHHLLSGVNISNADNQKLFRMDTIVFNELFVSEMRHNGWNFNAQWINNADSNKKANIIFIRSKFFTNANGVIINNYWWYLFGKLLPDLFFALIFSYSLCDHVQEPEGTDKAGADEGRLHQQHVARTEDPDSYSESSPRSAQ